MKSLLISFSILAFAVFVIGGCNTARPVVQQTPADQLNRGIGNEVITHSLFDSKDRTISEADIQRLLSGRIVLPDTIRIAVFKYAGTSMNRYYNYLPNDEEFLKNQQSYIDTLVFQLKTANKVSKVILIPSLMTGRFPNITQLRETAVRLQSDLLLVFSVNSDIYYKYKMFQRNEAKAFSTCETIVMDTRTGVVPFSSVITRENHVQKIQEDVSPNETRKRAEHGAVVFSLVDTGRSVAEFLNLP